MQSGIILSGAIDIKLVDICNTGDGAELAVRIANTLNHNDQLENIPNTGFKKNGGIVFNPKTFRDVLNKDNFIKYENFLDLEDYVNKFDLYLTRYVDPNSNIKRALPILTGLGCSFKCSFCENALLGHKHHSMTAEDIMEQITYYHKNFNIDAFAFFDEDFL